MNVNIVYSAAVAFIMTAALMPAMIRLAHRVGFTDSPHARESWRRMQKSPVANGGGIVLFLALVTSVLFFHPIQKTMGAVIFGGGMLVIFGTLDDIYDLPPWFQMVSPLLAVVSMTVGGIRINALTNPFGGTLDLTVIGWLPVVLTAFWVVGMISTIKFLDGIDGLSAGVGTIGAITLGIVALVKLPEDPEAASLSFTLAGGLLGYLVWNWHPARVYYGEAGAMLVGFILAMLAISSVGKLATAFIVMGLPILDTIRLIIHRLRNGRKPWQGGRDHLHHLLYDAGFGFRGTVAVYYLLSMILGIGALFSQAIGKTILAGGLILVMFILVIFLEKKIQNRGTGYITNHEKG